MKMPNYVFKKNGQQLSYFGILGVIYIYIYIYNIYILIIDQRSLINDVLIISLVHQH